VRLEGFAGGVNQGVIPSGRALTPARKTVNTPSATGDIRRHISMAFFGAFRRRVVIIQEPMSSRLYVK
jgi:hypothetical protein